MVEGGAEGPFNVVAPQQVTNAELTQALARALHRPAIISVPGFALRAALGELSMMLLTGQRVVPARALEMGFRFRFPRIDDALRDLL
jgi:NAD dependent epimerase/dehydratase family enzyme